ncbi:MAG: ABC transporter permease [Actinobacteria bacterium]|nr:ABC transporter permease [Actinomycetota bacterium]
MTAVPRGRGRFGLVLVVGQLRYALILLRRSPIGTFTALVIPLMVLVSLALANPQITHRDSQGLSYAAFVVPAMATFALLNACYVNTVTSVVLARESGVLKRLYGTPLPLWAYVVGRIAAAAAIAVLSSAVVLAVGALFMDVHLSGAVVADLAGVAGLGIVVFTTLALAVSALVPRAEAALAIAYGTMLPFAFVSGVFFQTADAPAWLRHTAALFPIDPIAESAERAVARGSGWAMSAGELGVTLGWITAASLFTSFGFRWEPGTSFLVRRRRVGE